MNLFFTLKKKNLIEVANFHNGGVRRLVDTLPSKITI